MIDPYWDIRGVSPAHLTRAQLVRALDLHKEEGADSFEHTEALLAACKARLEETTYWDGVGAERCALCLQRTFGELANLQAVPRG